METDQAVINAQKERDEAIQVKLIVIQEKDDLEIEKDKALTKANDLIDRLKTQLVKVEEQLDLQNTSNQNVQTLELNLKKENDSLKQNLI